MIFFFYHLIFFFLNFSYKNSTKLYHIKILWSWTYVCGKLQRLFDQVMTHAVCLYMIYIIFYQYKDYFYIFLTMTRLVHTVCLCVCECVQSICVLNLATFSRLIVTNLHHVDHVCTWGLATSPVFNFSLFQQQWYCDYLFVIPRTNTRQQTKLRGI